MLNNIKHILSELDFDISSETLEKSLEAAINDIWNKYEKHKQDFISHISVKDKKVIEEYISLLDKGIVRSVNDNDASWLMYNEAPSAASIQSTSENLSNWTTNLVTKKAILLYFAIRKSKNIFCENIFWRDKIPGKNFSFELTQSIDQNIAMHHHSTEDYVDHNAQYFIDNNIRVVPPAVVRKGSFLGKNVVLMPCFVNIGAYIGDGSMIDTWSTIGSCAYIGAKCHISGGVGIGGVLEPIGEMPVVIEDECFIGARSEIAEGVIIRRGSVIGMGVFIGKSTRIINRETGDVSYGEVPPYSVVVPGSVAGKNGININCAVIVKTVDEKTRSKTSINEILRT